MILHTGRDHAVFEALVLTVAGGLLSAIWAICVLGFLLVRWSVSTNPFGFARYAPPPGDLREGANIKTGQPAFPQSL